MLKLYPGGITTLDAPVKVDPRTLVTPRRLDLAVKWRFFRQMLNGGDERARRVYLWHIVARRRTGFVDGEKAAWMFIPMAEVLALGMYDFGFDQTQPIPIDPDGELLGGAHRTACALALGIDCYVQHMPQKAWAPAWDKQWFIDNGMNGEDLSRTLADFEEMQRQ